VVVDDVHRGGEQTLTILSELAGRVDDVPLLTLLAGRTEPAEWLSRFPTATKVPLGALSHEDAAALAGAFAGEKPIEAESARMLVERAHGNPLYMRELVVMARERGLLVDEGDVYRLVSAGEISSQAGLLDSVPATLQALLAARLDALDPAEKLVIQHVAVVGDAASAEQVSELGTPDATTALRSLADAGLLRQTGDGRYDTVDPLLREVAYETLPRNVRGELHRRVARTADRPEEKARHLDRAARYLADDEVAAAEAAEALADAGETLIEMSRHLDALGLLERAVALGCVRTSALLGLAKSQSLCGRSEDALKTLARIADDPSDPSVAIERDHTAASSKMFSDPAWALPRLQQVAERWLELGDIEKEAWARANAGVANFYSRPRICARALRADSRPRRRHRHVVLPVPRKAGGPARAHVVGRRPRVRGAGRRPLQGDDGSHDPGVASILPFVLRRTGRCASRVEVRAADGRVGRGIGRGRDGGPRVEPVGDHVPDDR